MGVEECEEKVARRDVTKWAYSTRVVQDDPAEGGVYTGTTGMPAGFSI